MPTPISATNRPLPTRPGSADGAFSFGYPMVFVEPTEDERTDAQQDYISGVLDDLAKASGRS